MTLNKILIGYLKLQNYIFKKLKSFQETNPEDFLDPFYQAFQLGHLLKIRRERYQQRKRRLCKQKFLKQAWDYEC